MTKPQPQKLVWGAVFGLVLLVLAACGGDGDSAAESDEPQLSGYSLEPQPIVTSITMPAANRDTDAFEFRADPGEILMVNFGFTSCPDICPTTLADTRIALNELGERSEDVDFAFISVDPERDTAEVLTNYVEAFLDNGIALRTDDPERLFVTADAFSVTYILEDNDAGEVEVAHTAHIYLVDDTGTIILTIPFGTPPTAIASDLNIMLDRQQAP